MVSTNILTIVKHFEGFEAQPYRDSVGVLTVGYGFTMGDVSKVELNKEIAHYALAGLMEELVDQLSNRNIRHFQTTRLEAYASLAYNVGLSAVLSSNAWTLRSQVAAAANFLEFRNAGGLPLLGLQRRRMSEVYYWFTGKVEFNVKPSMLPRKVVQYFEEELNQEFLIDE